MTSPFDGSQLKRVADHVYQDNSGGFFITDPDAIRQRFMGSGPGSGTREIKLQNLGVFPLAADQLPLLQRELEYEGSRLAIPALLKESQIPLFSSTDGQLVYIPPAACAICRYFHELWQTGTDDAAGFVPVLSGFAVLASYAGI
jgi:hypothetical protein